MSAAVSIIVPCYNVAPYLDKCMESLTLQTLGDLEIICVNDGSGDDTPAILRAWAERDGRIRVVDRENGGLSAARNTGMALAGGEYIGFVDPDDYVEHSMYGRLLEKARRSDADVTACGYTGFSDRDGSILEKWSLSPEEGVEENVQACVFQENAVWRRMAAVAWNKLYKREFLERNSLRFEPRFRQGEDDAFWPTPPVWPSFRTGSIGTAAREKGLFPCHGRKKVVRCLLWRTAFYMPRRTGKNAAGWNPAWNAAGFCTPCGTTCWCIWCRRTSRFRA